jgi:hypothetical protein
VGDLHFVPLLQVKSVWVHISGQQVFVVTSPKSFLQMGSHVSWVASQVIDVLGHTCDPHVCRVVSQPGQQVTEVCGHVLAQVNLVG